MVERDDSRRASGCCDETGKTASFPRRRWRTALPTRAAVVAMATSDVAAGSRELVQRDQRWGMVTQPHVNKRSACVAHARMAKGDGQDLARGGRASQEKGRAQRQR